MKTCGTTRILEAIKPLLDFASRLSLKPRRCKYTRGTFMYPAAQPYPHGSFHDEVAFLEQYFGRLGSGGQGYVLGNVSKCYNWHIYEATDDPDCGGEPKFTLEICMTKLDECRAARFFNADGKKSGADMTKLAKIQTLLPNSKICDFAFEPCGYSMNSLEGVAHSTIHVTPESGFSFASFETMGYCGKDTDLQGLVERVTSVFRPAWFSMCLYVSGLKESNSHDASWEKCMKPANYVCDGSSRQEFPFGSVVVYHTFKDLSVGDVVPVEPLPLSQRFQSLLRTPEFGLDWKGSGDGRNRKGLLSSVVVESTSRDERKGASVLDALSSEIGVALNGLKLLDTNGFKSDEGMEGIYPAITGMKEETVEVSTVRSPLLCQVN